MSEFKYKKISSLPPVTNLTDTDVFIVNANGTTSKIALSDLARIIVSSLDLTSLESRISGVETTTSTLTTTVNEQATTIENIITAGFNLIGVE